MLCKILTPLLGLLTLTGCFAELEPEVNLHERAALDIASDPEKRTERLPPSEGLSFIDNSACAQLPRAYREAVRDYLQGALLELQLRSISRQRYYHKSRESDPDRQPYERFPDDLNPTYDRDVVVPLTVLPRPEVIHRWTEHGSAKDKGWVPLNEALSSDSNLYGRTLIFNPGKLSNEPLHIPASPLGYDIPSSVEYVPAFDFNNDFFLPQGKIVCAPIMRTISRPQSDGSESLQIGKANGAEILAEITTVPVHPQNYRLRWVKLERPGQKRRQFLSYALCDGNGARRARWLADLPKNSPSHYVRPLICEQHQPQVRQHDLLLLPTPLDWPKGGDSAANDWNPHEEWCLDDWFGNQKHACWVLRETAESKPLQEAFILMPAVQQSELPIFSIFVFAETAPRQLIKELSLLYGANPDAVVATPETTERLQQLYDSLVSASAW